MMTFRSDQIIKAGVALALAFTLSASPSWAGEADVVAADIRSAANGSFTISATILHDDTGWDHYADAFEVVAPDGTILATRTLLHPHENEQPFTRSISGVEIPAGIESITIRAHDKVHGHGGATIDLDVVR